MANKHPRVNILQPSTGVGGHCIAIDPWFLISQDTKNTKLIQSARKVNNHKTKWVIDKIKNICAIHMKKTGVSPKIACLGLAFKPDIDDLRESKAIEVAETLLTEGYNIITVEPNIKSHVKFQLLNISDAIDQSDIVCVLVKHKEFLTSSIKDKLKKIGALDFCGVFS